KVEGQLGPDSPDQVAALSAVAELLVLHGDSAEAERLDERAAEIGRRQESMRSHLGAPLAQLSRLYLARGEVGRAEGAAAASLAARAERFPRNDPRMLGSHRALFDVALAKGDLEQARQQAELYQSIADGWLAADDPLRMDAVQLRARLLLAGGDRSGAVALL